MEDAAGEIAEVKALSREELRALKDAQRMEKEKERAEKKMKRESAKAEKEALKQDKEIRREQAEVEKERRRREREAKRQNEETKRKEKEASERRKIASIQKQAHIMDRFLKKDVEASPPQAPNPTQTPPAAASRRSVVSMDIELAGNITSSIEELFRKHLEAWRTVRGSGKVQRWGMRRAPKVQLFKELKVREEMKVDAPSSSDSPARKKPRMKLLQFHKCFRPAYYGTFAKKSKIIAPRHPLAKEPSLEYDIDSDDEWEEEAPGESLSDVDEVEEEDTEEEPEDDFVVPDGYLSENEGIEVERVTASINDIASSSENQDPDKMQNILKFVTERALKTNRAYVIQNFGAQLEPDNVRECCLQALSIQVRAPDVVIRLPDPRELEESRHVEAQRTKRGRKSSASLVEAALPEIVQHLEEHPQGLGMKKTVEALSQKFPRIAKSQLELKIREITDYVENRWKVKEEFLSLVQAHKKMKPSEEESESNLPAIPCKPLSNLSQKRCLPLDETCTKALRESSSGMI